MNNTDNVRYDLVIQGGQVVIPYVGVQKVDIGIKSEKIAAIQSAIPSDQADEVLDATGRYVFPGAIDSHFHKPIGIQVYKPAAKRRIMPARSINWWLITSASAGDSLRVDKKN